ncbi:LysR family transcriptional regulator [Streptomyces galbus]|uniref:LysR family transcriptional regulator n=1 Tax=Streptomyces galbus TaxID=33898 RepID=UPI003789780F
MPPTPPPSVDLDLRLVRYFAAVAEHRHFGRAADALRIAQPSLSRQIRRLEQQVGARLLDRTPRGTRLTEAGEAFLPRARALLRAAAEAAAYARSAGESDVLTVGYTLGIIVTPAVRELRRRRPGADVRAVHLKWNESRDALLDHRVDAAVTRQPLRPHGLEVTPLYDEPRVLVVPLDHRLAGKESVTLDDLADEPMPVVQDAAWNAYWRIDPRPDGRPAPGGPVVEELEDKFEVIADGRAVAIVPMPRTRTLRPDLTTVPLEDVGPTPVLLVTREGDRRRLLTEFRRTAQALLTGPA